MTQYIDGAAREGSGGEYVLRAPATGREIRRYRLADAGDVDDAVQAAARAFPAWSRRTPAERAQALLDLADALEARAEQLAQVESSETGKALRLAQEFDVPGTIDNARFFAGAARNLTGLAAGEYWPGATSLTRREALGVVGSIAPWNYPLQMAAWKIFPAIAAGNTIVLKTSEMTPGTTLLLAEAATEAGIPAGVVNVIAGDGRTAGEALVSHPLVVMTSFTGSTAVGRRVMELASAKGARVHLELGGKAPLVVFDDADCEAAARGAVAGSLINGGQDCTAATRAYVARPLFETFCDRVAELMDGVVVGDPSSLDTDMGALISPHHRDRVAGFVERARRAGARIRSGGVIPESPEGSSFYRPTLVTGVGQDSEVVQEEIFGPVLVALPFDSDDEAMTLANDSPYGLAASAWTQDLRRALRAAEEISAGCVWINEHIPIMSEMPHGGYKASGFGKDMSQFSLDEYTQVKHVFLDRTASPSHAWQDTIFRG